MPDRIPTLADICCAIAEGHIPASVDGSVYQVNARELRRYLNQSLALPALPQLSALSADSPEWTVPTQISVA
jgi:hypothetical protein